MEQKSNNKAVYGPGWQALLSLTLVSVSFILASPRWHLAVFAWIGPVAALYFFRVCRLKRKWLWFIPFMTATILVSMYGVIPFPPPVLLTFALLGTVRWALIFLLDKWVTSRIRSFLGTLFFPCVYIAAEFLMSRTGGGVWWSAGNSQFAFTWLIQIVSITGIWGIGFLIYWFASVVVWSLVRFREERPWKRGLTAYATVLLAVLAYGAFRFHFPVHKAGKVVLIAGVTSPQIPFLEGVYSDYYRKSITIDPRSSVTDPVLQDVRNAEGPFIEKADTLRFRKAREAMRAITDSLFSLSQQAAAKGAKIITWSEANCLALPRDEPAITARGISFASANRVYLLMALGVIHSGPVTPGTKFLENKAILLGPDGTVLNVFHKNNPVPFAEASEAGNGIIPVIVTPYGRLSTSICYDADFPDQMRQLGKNKSDILLLPSGDWYAISPYHSYMALFRGIENGCSVVRQVSGGLSLAADYRGRIYASQDYYNPGPKAWIAEVPVEHVFTLYSVIGDGFAFGCIGAAALILLLVAAGGRGMEGNPQNRHSPTEG